jgi:hypothetical protein
MNPIILPPSWKQISSPLPFQKCFRKFNGLIVLVGQFDHEGDRWLHVSCSHKNKLPKWKELREVKDIFVGKDKQAIQIFPPESQYVNIMKFCLHLWCNLSRDIVPDFTRVIGMI